MEPRIQYAQTRDGVSIAFWTMGEGPPLVYMPNVIWSHAQLEWQFPEIRSWYERLAERRKLVRFDTRGTGLSERTVTEYSLEALEHDLQAVVDRLELPTFAIFASINAVPPAIAFAADNPERVSHLVLWCYAPNLDLPGSRYQSLRALQPVMEKDWETFTEVRAGLEFGWSAGELAHRYAAFLRECISPQMASRIYGAVEAFDVLPRLPGVRSPTLVLHRQQLYFWDVETARSLAAKIEGARLTVLEGVATAPFLGDVEELERTIDEFLASDSDEGPAPEPPSGTAVILFADIAESTALTERLGDAAFREKTRLLDEALRSAIRERGGTPIEGKLLGDGVLATFASAKDAIEAALACGDAGDAVGLGLHLGLHAGDVIREESNVFGGAVTIASRISDLAPPGEVLVSQTVRDLARTSAGVSFEDCGERELKGVGEPVRVWAVRRE